MLVRHLILRLSVVLCCAPALCFAQMTAEQKMTDFRQLTAFYQRYYAPAEWKKQLFGFDLFNTAPWFDRVAKSRDDLEFYEICVEYVASLNDTHSAYRMPSNWSASLGFTVDSYQGSILIDGIDRNRLPVDQFPFQIGDQLESVDGVDVESWIERLSKWVASSNARSKRSQAAHMLQQTQAAYTQGADFTPPYPLIGATALRDPSKDNQGNVIAYTKPIMLLTDDLTVSAADAFAALFQDNQRGIIFGIRTNGAGGNNFGLPAGAYSQGSAGAELNLNVRNHTVNAPGYPPTRYFDNVGVHPDVGADLMTKENLLNQGVTFSRTMVAAITNYIQQQNHK